MTKSDPINPSTHSLRTRYLVAANIVAALIIVAAVFTNHYVLSVTRENSNSLQVRDDLAKAIQRVNQEIRVADRELQNMLFSPSSNQETIIQGQWNLALKTVEKIQSHPGLAHDDLPEKVSVLKSHMQESRRLVLQLIELRKDSRWTYPALPFITEYLLEPNVAFERATSLALEDIEFQSREKYATELYRNLDEIRDLWRRMILNFRAIMIRYAGLHDVDPNDQEYNVEQLHQVVMNKLRDLQQNPKLSTESLQTSQSLEEMIISANEWMRNFREVMKLRRSSQWRADVEFLNQKIIPAQDRVFSSLNDLENEVERWSVRNTQAVENAASSIVGELWVLTGIALVFVTLVYIMLDRQIFRPIAHVANALTATAEQSDYEALPRHGAQEIHKLIIAFEDMRSQVRHRQLALEHQALHDSLTGLANRALLQDRIEQAILHSHRNLTKVALFILDLDRFKEINDTLGHQVGDRILQQVADRLKRLLRESDTVARLGGDEFAILSQDTDHQGAATFARKVADALQQEYRIQHHNLYAGASIGIAIYPEHGNDAQTLVRRADIAMYTAKRSNMEFAFYNADKDEHSIDQLSLVGDLRTALQSNELMTYYQPKVDLQTSQIIGMEALLRWNHTDKGFIPPEKVIRLAEHTGMISRLTLWVIESAVRHFAPWSSLNKNLTLSVNLSAWNLQDPELPNKIFDILRQYKLDASRLVLEITEGAVMTDPARARETLDILSQKGAQISIDDFGTGFSSLGYLKLLPVAELKIDKSFVRDMLSDENDEVIVRSTIDLAHNLRLRVVAEGVEDRATWERLQSLGCDIAQGYFVSRPVEHGEMEKLLKQHSMSDQSSRGPA